MARQGIAETAGQIDPPPFGRLLGPCWIIFRIVSYFWVFLGPSYAILVFRDVLFNIFLIFRRFGVDFGRILGRFFNELLHFSLKSRFCKNHRFSLGKLLFSRIRACKNPTKFHQKSMQISPRKIKTKKILQK